MCDPDEVDAYFDYLGTFSYGSYGNVDVYDSFYHDENGDLVYTEGNPADEGYDLFPDFNPPEGCYSIEV